MWYSNVNLSSNFIGGGFMYDAKFRNLKNLKKERIEMMARDILAYKENNLLMSDNEKKIFVDSFIDGYVTCLGNNQDKINSQISIWECDCNTETDYHKKEKSHGIVIGLRFALEEVK